MFLARVAGGILLTFGIGLAVLVVVIVERQFTLFDTWRTSAVVMAISFALVSAFCLLVGYRLLFNRPNRYGSLLSPGGWRTLAAFFGLIALAIAIVAIKQRVFAALAACAGLGLLAYRCIVAGKAASARSAPSTVFPRDASLLRMEGFTPAGFVHGLEILNDERTPMEFVVSVLQDIVGLSKGDAVRTMLEIHSRGGVLLPMRSLTESRRLAGLVTLEASRNGYALVCRAVSLDQPRT